MGTDKKVVPRSALTHLRTASVAGRLPLQRNHLCLLVSIPGYHAV